MAYPLETQEQMLGSFFSSSKFLSESSLNWGRQATVILPEPRGGKMSQRELVLPAR